MNYLRGSITAAYQYYRDLPPINASTLTGAIDVIVIQRTDEHGQTVLACTPFHVRFGKLQILRPGEKKVNVRVNGHPIPFNMKIGEAGEAFFVFETEEDVPEELITSPILQASSPKTAASDLTAQHVGRFGAKGSDSDLHDSENQEALEEEINENAIPEPDFLDLDAISTKPDEISVPREGVATPSNLAPLQPTSMEDQPTKPSTLLTRRNDLGNTTIKAVQEGKRIDELNGDASTVEQKLSTRIGNSLSHLKRSSADELSTNQAIENGENIPFKEERKDPNPPVAYLGDVVIDMAGYHSKEASDATVKGDRGRVKKLLYETEVPLNVAEDAQALLIAQHKVATISELTPTSSTAASPTLSPTTPSTAVSLPRPVRATSEPLELEVSPKHPSSLTNPPSLQNSLPKYSWEWGGFPVQTPSKNGFNLAHGLERGEMERNTSLPTPGHSSSPSPEPEDESRGPIHSKDSDEDDFDINFGRGARLSSAGEFGYSLDVKGRSTRFELSLCGDISTKSREEAEEIFREDRISFQRFIEDPKVVHRDELCILWKGRFISRKQSSPILPALVVWRQATLGNSIVQSDEEPLSSADEKEERQERPQQTKAVPVPASTGGRWSRWFGRSTSRREVATTTNTPNGDRTRTPDILKPPASAPLQSTPVAEKPINSAIPQAQPNGTSPGATSKDERHYVKTLRLTSDQLKELNLKKGPNSITFSISATGEATCTARIFVWDATDQIVISDIDGTITKSDALGHVFTMIGRDWTHSGVAKLYTDICRNGYKIMYLTSRAIGQADSTRDYLRGIKQNDYQLPEGPVIMSPDRLMASLHREVIMRQPEVFKMACLRDIQRLFGPVHRNPFYAGFGNRITDALSYRSVNVPSGRIFTIDSSGEVKMELLELAGYKSSYIHMTDLVDQMFPPIHRKWAPEFTDANFWRQPIAEFDFPDFRPVSPQPAGTPAPPSPALSARSDASLQTGFSRLRNFSLRGGRPAPAQEFIPAGTKTNGVNGNTGHQRAKSSIGQGFPSSVAHSRHTSAGVEGMAIPRGTRNGEDMSMHRLSGGSMPGSYDGFRLDDDYDEEEEEDEDEDEDEEDEEDEEDDEEYDDDEGEDEEDELPHVDEEHEFDDELLATGAMDSIPYI